MKMAIMKMIYKLYCTPGTSTCGSLVKNILCLICYVVCFQLYIGDENSGANEYHFKIALDLLQYVDKVSTLQTSLQERDVKASAHQGHSKRVGSI